MFDGFGGLLVHPHVALLVAEIFFRFAHELTVQIVAGLLLTLLSL